MKLKFSILLLSLLVTELFAQRDMSWQDNYPNASDWSNYIQMSSKYMGPNALPVPEVYEANVLPEIEIEGGYSYYKHKNIDAPTHASFIRIYCPVAKQRVGVEVSVVPFESYKYSDNAADYLHSIATSGSGGGDIFVNTYIQILRQNMRRPDLTLRYSMRTASGGNVNDARCTDSPGYSFDLAVGKDVFAEDNQRVKFFAMLGFYCWQIEDGVNRQDDAFSYGLGASYHNKDWTIKWDLGGYTGYKNNGDSPVVMRFCADFPIVKKLHGKFLYESGLNDYPYRGYHLRLVYLFSPFWDK